MNKRLLPLIFLMVFTVYSGGKVEAQEEGFIAASIYNFTRNIQWPANVMEGNFVIDVIGHKSVYDKLNELMSGRKVGSQNVEVRFLETINGISKSHILFVGFWQSKDLATVVAKVGNSPTLIVSEKDGLIEFGSGINFIIRNNAIKFEIKKANITKYGLIVAEDLTSMAYKNYP